MVKVQCLLFNHERENSPIKDVILYCSFTSMKKSFRLCNQMKSRLAIIWFFLLLLFVNTLPAFSQQIIFNKVIPPEGKFNPLVTCITQDINGYMWFATPTGLYRY